MSINCLSLHVKFQSVQSRVNRFNYISEFFAYLDNIVRAHVAQKDILWSLFIHHYVLCLASQQRKIINNLILNFMVRSPCFSHF